jgi:hypothetical protein
MHEERRMSAQPEFPFESLDEATELRLRVAEALCMVAESLAMAGRIREARRAMAAVQKIIDHTTRLAASSPRHEAAAEDLRAGLDELQHRARNTETVLKLLE